MSAKTGLYYNLEPGEEIFPIFILAVTGEIGLGEYAIYSYGDST